MCRSILSHRSVCLPQCKIDAPRIRRGAGAEWHVLGAGLIVCALSGGDSITFFVAPSSELQGLREARDAIRQHREMFGDKLATVYASPGTYIMNETLVFEAQGSNICNNISWRVAPGARSRPRHSGGQDKLSVAPTCCQQPARVCPSVSRSPCRLLPAACVHVFFCIYLLHVVTI
jgi:hypothetical protein